MSSSPATFDLSGRNYADIAGPRSRFFCISLLIGPPLFWIISLAWSRIDPSSFVSLAREDGVIENTQVIVLVFASLISARISWVLHSQNEKRWALVYALMCLAIVFVAGEEISWGQRMFGVETPEWFKENNRQDETTIHNLKELFPVVTQLYNIVPVTLAILSAASAIITPPTRKKWRAGLWMPHIVLLPSWLCCVSYRAMRTYTFITHPDLKRPPPILSRLQ